MWGDNYDNISLSNLNPRYSTREEILLYHNMHQT